MTAIGYAVSAGVAHVRLSRPEAANALDLTLARELGEAVRRAAEDDDVRVVLVTGDGARFCAGGDLTAIVGADDPTAYVLELATVADEAIRALAELAKPVVGVVQGAVAGAGLGLMLSCDLVVADPGTRFVFAYPKAGLTPDCGVSWLLPRAVGQQRALAFALGGEPLDAQTALDWGLVTEVTEGTAGTAGAADATRRGQDLAASLADQQPRALGRTRQLLRSGWETTRAETGAIEARTIAGLIGGDEAQAQVARFRRG